MSGYSLSKTSSIPLALDSLTPCKSLRKLLFLDCPSCTVSGTDVSVGWTALAMPLITSVTIQMKELPILSYYSTNGYPHIDSGADLLRPILPAFPNLEYLDISNLLTPPSTPHSSETLLDDITAHTYIFLLRVRKETKIDHLVIRFPTTNEILKFEREAEDRISNPLYGFVGSLWHEW